MFFNSSTAKIFAFAASAALLPAVAHAEDYALERDGVSYVYAVSTEQGRTVITGTANRTIPFRLVVRGQRVTGEYNHNQTEFSLREVKRIAQAVAVR